MCRYIYVHTCMYNNGANYLVTSKRFGTACWILRGACQCNIYIPYVCVHMPI